ncbi:hypothetical protein [Pinibacter aurantiacus]|uniref:Uncharacterized protein n=1 Tax=Pinibacter aurantiacus TaxID=2851599 RepID=A0A9E2S9E6_9BACT|nr:hypothetical protein [Pinibacter aurantiacus]MBV4356360.1 hypothetical protein [Pinibacter aurantiacus]
MYDARHSTSSARLVALQDHSIVSDDKAAKGNRVELRGYKPRRANDNQQIIKKQTPNKNEKNNPHSFRNCCNSGSI